MAGSSETFCGRLSLLTVVSCDVAAASAASPTVTVSFTVGHPSLSVIWLLPARVIRNVVGAASLNPERLAVAR